MKIIKTLLLANLLLLAAINAGAQVLDDTDANNPDSKAASDVQNSDQNSTTEHYKKANKETDATEDSATEPVALQQGALRDGEEQGEQPLIVTAPI